MTAQLLQVLGKPTSINVRKVLWLCAELQLPYELQQYGPDCSSPLKPPTSRAVDSPPPSGSGHRPTEAPGFLALNPNALVPVIRDGEFVLWESNTICRYLASAYPKQELLPSQPQERARIEQWMDWQATELNNSWRYAFSALVRQSAAHTDQAAIASSINGWNRHMGILDGQLRKTKGFAAGPRFSLADIVLGLSTHRWYSTPLERPALPAVEDYYNRLSERPAFLAHGRNGVP
jgi:glutathione S-transferase